MTDCLCFSCASQNLGQTFNAAATITANSIVSLSSTGDVVRGFGLQVRACPPALILPSRAGVIVAPAPLFCRAAFTINHDIWSSQQSDYIEHDWLGGRGECCVPRVACLLAVFVPLL